MNSPSAKSKTIIIMGPTATGKTAVAVALAHIIDGEIISADSRQVYKGMDIGTGKDLSEYGDIPYHLIDVAAAGEEFTVSDFQIQAHTALEAVNSKGKVPIICGGTGHYIKALIDDYSLSSHATNLELTTDLESLPRSELYTRLKSYGLWKTHHWENDSKRRIARALEKAISPVQSDKPSFNFRSKYIPRIYYLSFDRSLIKDKICKRLEARFKEGMTVEVEKLLLQGVHHDRLERYGLEYKWISRHLRGLLSEEELLEKLIVEIGRYAKRQMTFIRYMERSGTMLIPVTDSAFLLEDAKNWLKQNRE